MFGPMVAGTSSAIIVSFANKLGVREETSIILIVESTITDVLNVITFFTILEIYSRNIFLLKETLGDMASRFSIGIVLGFFIGIAWIRILHKVRKMEFTYMSTFAILIGCYVLAALFFGLVLGNTDKIVNFLG